MRTQINEDREYLLKNQKSSIRTDEIISQVEKRKQKIKGRLVKTSTLPERIDVNQINSFLIEIRKTYINKKIISWENEVLAIILALLFQVYIVHWFYLNKNDKGVKYLVITTIIGFVTSFFDYRFHSYSCHLCVVNHRLV